MHNHCFSCFFLIAISLLLRPATGLGQTESTDSMTAETAAEYIPSVAMTDTTASLQSVAPADSLPPVSTAEYRKLLRMRMDSLVADTLMETTQLGLMLWDLTDDILLYQHDARQLLRPASTMKLLTAITALDRLGPDYHFNTLLYYKGTITRGQLRGDLICVGGMDPMFDATDMKAFAMAVRQKGITSISGRIVCDYSMKEQDKWGEGWCWDDKNPTLSALLIDGTPMFATELARQLRAAGVSTAGVSTAAGKVPAGATLVAARRHSLDDVLQQMMKDSDNLYAESVYYQVAASSGNRPATARHAQKIETELMQRAGLKTDAYRLADGSGLSLYNYLSAEAEVMLLRYAWQRPVIYSHLLPSLPIAGIDGTMKKRMTDDEACCGNVMAKTGTVSGISSLAGYLTAPDGHRLAFAIINQGIRHAADGRGFQDRLCHILCTAR